MSKWLTFATATILITGAAGAAPNVFRPFPLSVPTDERFALAILDSRPDVVSGERQESFLGFRRSLMGIPYPRQAPGDKPLAEHFGTHLARAFSLGDVQVEVLPVSPYTGREGAIDALRASGASRLALLEIREWWSDQLINTDLHHNLELIIFNSQGQELGSTTSIGHDELGKKKGEGLRDLVTATNYIFTTIFTAEPIVLAFDQNAVPAQPEETGCTVEQILKMQAANLTQEQIEAACATDGG